MKYFYIIFLMLVSYTLTYAQKLTGTWQGTLDNDEFLEINIIEIKNNVCGYTYDYDLYNKRSFCKAYFNGDYNKKTEQGYIEGYAFMQNSGSHVLMQLKFKLIRQDGELTMIGVCRIKPSLFSIGASPSRFELKKTANAPTIITQTMKDCLAEFNPPKKQSPKLESITKNNPPINKKPIIISPPIKNDSVKTIPKKIIDTPKNIEPIITQNTSPNKTNGRVNKELKRIAITDKKITLNLYDNGTIDGDTISVFYNGKEIVHNKRLTANPILVDVVLDENVTQHSIVMYANNLGSIPPNTALIIFTTANGKRYELYASATLQQNAEIIFEYKPN